MDTDDMAMNEASASAPMVLTSLSSNTPVSEPERKGRRTEWDTLREYFLTNAYFPPVDIFGIVPLSIRLPMQDMGMGSYVSIQ